LTTGFDPETHTYTINDVRVPGTTDILKAGGGYRGWQWMPASARIRGSRVHEVIELLNLGQLTLDQIEGDERPWAIAWDAFVREGQLRVKRAEWPVWYQQDGVSFGTHIDVVGWVVGQQDTTRPAVIDVKTGARDDTVGPQTAAQVLGLDGRVSTRDRYAVYLTVRDRKGAFVVDHRNDPRDFDRFFSAYRDWKEAHP
jgi:hypothetical protein